VTLSAVALALALGWMQAPFLQYLRPVGDFYVALLQMCVLPFLLATIPLAVRSAMTSGTVGSIVRLSVIWAVAALATVAVAAIVISSGVFHGFALDEDTLARIGVLIGGSSNRIDIEFALDPGRSTTPPPAESGIINLVPINIFASLAGNDSSRVLIFAAIFGIAMVMTERESGGSILGALK
jgi:Na+/H+-dicarboxylate symporter